MNSFFRTVPVMVAGFLLLGATGAKGEQPLSPYRHYNSNTFIHGNFKPFFQKQWKARLSREAEPQPGPQGEPRISPLLLPLSVSSFGPGGGPVMPRRLSERVKELDSDQRKALENALQQLLLEYGQLLEQQDQQQLKRNLAGAFNYFFMAAYYALRDGQELSGAQQQSMLEQINAAIAMGLNERRLSDSAKHELYESVVLSGSIILGLYNEGRDKGRPELQKEARELAKELLDQMMGIRIEKVRLEGDSVWID